MMIFTQHSAAAQEHQSRFSWTVAPSDCHHSPLAPNIVYM